MIVAPETEIYLLKTPLQVDELQQLDFANATAQLNYFRSLPQLALYNTTFQRENSTMYVKYNIEQIRNYNYVLYRNSQYSDKWFYAFITGMTYESNVVTGVQIKTDVFQTYMFEYQLKESYILRETVDDDTYGKNLISESFDLGNYVLKETDYVALVQNTSEPTPLSPLIVVQCSERLGVCYDNPQYQNEYDDMYITSGLPQGCWYYMYDTSKYGVESMKALKNYLDRIGKGNAILNMFLIPHSVVKTKDSTLRLYDGEGQLTDYTTECKIVSSNTWGSKLVTTKTVTRPTNFGKGNNTFTPHNNKTLTYPYCYLLASNSAGSAIDYHYENFTGNPVFKIFGALSANTSYALMPDNSITCAGVEYGMSTEVLQGAMLPTLSWDSDYYLNWVAQNKGMNDLAQGEAFDQLFWGTIGDFTTSLTGFGIGQVDPNIYDAIPFAGNRAMSGLTGRAINYHYTKARVEEANKVAQAVPNTVKGNLGAGDLSFSFASIDVGFKFYKYEVRLEIAKKVDRYFDMYGYRVNEIKVPNTKTRKYWNYLETEKVNLEGDIPQEALQELKAIYNAGITIWHDPSNFLNYDLVNSIL